MNRRDALVTIGVTTLGGGVTLTSPPLLHVARALAGQAALATPADQAVDDRLREDTARLSARVNSEEGVPMILACDNLVPANGTHQAPKVALTPTNTALAAAFHRNAEAWLRIHPDAQYKDVAQLIEVVTYRDFSQGGKAGETL